LISISTEGQPRCGTVGATPVVVSLHNGLDLDTLQDDGSCPGPRALVIVPGTLTTCSPDLRVAPARSDLPTFSPTASTCSAIPASEYHTAIGLPLFGNPSFCIASFIGDAFRPVGMLLPEQASVPTRGTVWIF